ncbi:MAG TPA: flagellar export chaperone FlgN [Jatrophihabitans sp.]
MTHLPRAALHPVPDAAGLSGGIDVLGELAEVLWRERKVLEDLLFALSQQQLLLDAGQTRWLPRVDAAVAAAARAVQDHEVVRAIEVETLVQILGLPGDASLVEIASHAGEPWATVLGDHRVALRTLTTEIETVTAHNRTLLLAGERATREALEQLAALAPSAKSSGRYDDRVGPAASARTLS